jgi:hypothetical protein
MISDLNHEMPSGAIGSTYSTHLLGRPVVPKGLVEPGKQFLPRSNAFANLPKRSSSGTSHFNFG